MEHTIDRIFEDFNKLKVMIIGDVMVDSYILGKVDRISPEAPIPILLTKKREFRLGGAANVALNIQALGATPILCAIIGSDENGEKLIERLSKRRLSSQGIVRSTYGRPTTTKTRVISGSQHVVRIDTETQHVVRIDTETNAPLTTPEEDGLLNAIKLGMEDSDVVIFEDYDKGTITPRIIDKTMEIANAAGIPVAVDPKKRNFFNYKNCTLFKPNLDELKEGLKIDFKEENMDDIQEASEKLRQKINCEHTLITLSSQGIIMNSKGSMEYFPAHLREISDVSGAGDTVISVAALGLALNLPSSMIAQLANIGGGLVCEHMGVVPIKKDELFLEAKKYNL